MHCRGAGGRTAGREPLPSADPRRAAGHGSYRNPRLSTWGRPARSWFRVGTRWASGQRNRSSGTGSARAFASPDHSPLFLGAKLLTHTATCCRSARESHERSRASGDGVVDAGRLDRAAPGASRPAATQTPAVLMVNVQTSPRAASLGCPGWLQAPSRPGAGRDVWQPQDWTLGLWTSIGPSSVSAENFFSPLRLPGRRRGSHGGLAHGVVHALGQLHDVDGRPSARGRAAGGRRDAGVVRYAARVYRCHATTQAITCKGNCTRASS